MPQTYGLWAGENDDTATHDQHIAKVNRARKKRGLPPLTDSRPEGLTDAMIEANLKRAAELRGQRRAKEG